MEIRFEKEYLSELFNEGKTNNKKYRFQPQVIKQYIKTVNTLRNSPDTEFLYRVKSLHYEKKTGDLKGIEAVWVNDQYRLEFNSFKEADGNKVITICSLSELSKHYKK